LSRNHCLKFLGPNSAKQSGVAHINKSHLALLSLKHILVKETKHPSIKNFYKTTGFRACPFIGPGTNLSIYMCRVFLKGRLKSPALN
jgi:hypothetical protein